jgi:hypothetical protein
MCNVGDNNLIIPGAILNSPAFVIHGCPYTPIMSPLLIRV